MGITLAPSQVFSSIQSLSRVWLFATPWTPARQASLSIINSRNSLRLTSIKSVMSSSHLILCRPLLLLIPIPPSIRVFSNESTIRMRWPKHPKTHINQINKVQTQRTNIKTTRGKRQITHKGIPLRIAADLSIETLQAREWQDILKVMKENNLQPRLLYPARISFK